MDYTAIMNKMEFDRSEAESKAKECLKELVLEMKLAGVESVSIYFDGSGDNGSIEEVSIYPYKGDFTAELENWAYQFLGGIGCDWYNNAGGFGSIDIDVVNNSFDYVVEQRIETSEVFAVGTEEI